MIVHDDQVITAQKSLKVPLVERTLTITATPSKPQLSARRKGQLRCTGVGLKGKPVEADLSFGEVDEALYSVRPDESGNIVASFYPSAMWRSIRRPRFVFLFRRGGNQESVAGAAERWALHPRMAQVKPGSDLVVPKVRKAFPTRPTGTPMCAPDRTATRGSSSTSPIR